MIPSLLSLTRRYGRLVKFAAVGGAASVVHGSISWIFYYHVLCGRTVLSTLAGYGGGWLASYLGNRLWTSATKRKNHGRWLGSALRAQPTGGHVRTARLHMGLPALHHPLLPLGISSPTI